MAFVRAELVLKPANIGTGIKIGLRGKANPSLIINLTAATGVALGFDGHGDRAYVLIGTDGDHGILRLKPVTDPTDDSGVKVEKISTGKAPYWKISLGRQDRFVRRAEANQWCKWERLEGDDAGWIEIHMPKWADETAPNQTKASLAKAENQLPASGSIAGLTRHTSPTVQAAREQQKPRNVVHRENDGPAPGRKEMLAKMGNMKL